MDKKEVVEILIQILRDVQEDLGGDVPNITENTRPIGDLESFDSLSGVGATIGCIKRFDLDKIKDLNVFVGETASGVPYALTVGQAADKILKLKGGS